MLNYIILFRITIILVLCEKSLSGNFPLFSTYQSYNDENILEEVNLNFMGLAKKYGHPAEEHKVITEDGYILTVHHIPGEGCPVFLQHGVIDSDDTFILRGNKSLAITLANAGYDVWLGNTRGNKYSRNHVHLNPDTDKQYWNFTVHEVGYYDLPAMIDFVMERTHQTKLIAIGHSQGNAIFYVMGASRPKYNDKIKVLIALAPICFLHNVRAPLNSVVEIAPAINKLLESLHQEELLNDNTIIRKFTTIMCRTLPFRYKLCVDIGFFLLGGSDPDEFETEFLDMVTTHYPTGTSRSNVLHLAQIAKSKRFQKLDHGITKNLQVYGSKTPPEYDLSKVTMRVELFVGKNDKVATEEDVNILHHKLPNSKYTLIKHNKMNHLDFVWGKNMNEYLFPLIMQVIEENCNSRLPYIVDNVEP